MLSKAGHLPGPFAPLSLVHDYLLIVWKSLPAGRRRLSKVLVLRHLKMGCTSFNCFLKIIHRTTARHPDPMALGLLSLLSVRMDELFFWLGWLGQQFRCYFLAIPFPRNRNAKTAARSITGYEHAPAKPGL